MIRKVKNTANIEDSEYQLIFTDDIWSKDFTNIKEKTIKLNVKRDEFDKYKEFDSSQLDLFIEEIEL